MGQEADVGYAGVHDCQDIKQNCRVGSIQPALGFGQIPYPDKTPVDVIWCHKPDPGEIPGIPPVVAPDRCFR